MSDKPKVYQGVRVKTTVKELLQQRRALQAERIKTVKTKSQSLACQDACISTLPAHYFDAFSGEANPDISFQPRSYPEHSCNMQMERALDYQQPISSMMIPNEGYNIGILPPPPSSAQPWSHGHHSPNVDYHNHGMAPASPSDSLNLGSPVDYNSYSPQESYSSSSSSSCYNSPTRMDSGYGFVPEHYHYQHCNLQHCYCLSHWSRPQESVVPDYTLRDPTDCVYAPPMESSYFRRDLISDMCYL